jgi:hypothetical protein
MLENCKPQTVSTGHKAYLNSGKELVYKSNRGVKRERKAKGHPIGWPFAFGLPQQF